MTGKRHGKYNTRVNRIWRQMKYRCTNSNAPEYKNYGARGITYDPRWEEFKNFLEDMGEPEENLTLERKDNSKGYSKENCYWATYKEQQNNKRTNNVLTAFGRTQTLTQWSEETGIPVSTLRNRMFRSSIKKLSLEEAMTATLYAQQRSILNGTQSPTTMGIEGKARLDERNREENLSLPAENQPQYAPGIEIPSAPTWDDYTE